MRAPATILITLTCMAAAAPVSGQAPPTARPAVVRIVVRDATDLPIASAQVTLSPAETTASNPQSAGPVYHLPTSDRGEAVFEQLQPGIYRARVESPGFEPFELEPFPVRAGARVRRDVELRIAGFLEELEVAPGTDDQQLMNAFTSELTPEQLAALPEDPEELALVLQQLLGDDADIRVDGFSGGRLPPGAQIREVRIKYDGGSASGGGGPRVEIRTVPGGDRWRNVASVNLRDESLNARNAFSGERPAGQTRQYSWNLNGPLVRNRTGYSLSVDGSESVENQTIRAAVPGGVYRNLIEQPANRLGLWTRLEHEVNPSGTIRVDFYSNRDEAGNQGLGEFDLPERAFSREGSSGGLRAGHHATIRRRFVNDLRMTLDWTATESSSISDARTVRVLDAFTSGGAQQQGGQRSRSFEVEDEVEWTVRGRHRLSAGLSVNGSSFRGDEHRNAAGTFTFASLESYEAGLPTTFTQRVGDPAYEYSMFRFGWRLEDDYRVRRNVMLNLGLRHEIQTHLRDWVNLSPRIGVNWTPSQSTRTSLRASFGIFHSPLDAGTYLQTLVVNGEQQRDLVVASPGYPDPFSAGVTRSAAPPSVIRARPDLVMPFNRRYTLGLDQPFGKTFRLRGTFTHQTGNHIFRSRDVNAPVDGVRADPSARNITELESTAGSLNRSLRIELSANYPPRRFSSNVNYVFGEAWSDTDGPFSLPPDSLDVSGEWGPARNDVRHRVNAGLTSDVPGGFRVNANLRAQSASPYNITTGTDANGDGSNNERPAGIGRNSGRGATTRTLDVTLTWGVNVGRRQLVEPPRGGKRGPEANALVRFEIFARANNALNTVNWQSYSGVLTSPFFGLPTSAGAARRIVVGTKVWF